MGQAPDATEGLSDEALLALFPEALPATDPPNLLQENAKTDDGCAFAGTWRYDHEIANGRIKAPFPESDRLPIIMPGPRDLGGIDAEFTSRRLRNSFLLP